MLEAIAARSADVGAAAEKVRRGKGASIQKRDARVWGPECFPDDKAATCLEQQRFSSSSDSPLGPTNSM